MKNIKYLFILFVVVMASVSCNNDDDINDGVKALIGTWELTEMDDQDVEINLKATFIENGTGKIVAVYSFMGESNTENSNFTWITNGNKLIMNIDGEGIETSTYSISGDKLTLTDNEGSTTVLTRV